MDDVKADAQQYLEKQKKHFGVKVAFHGSDKKRYQIEIPDSQIKKIGAGYELQSQRKGYKRYYTAETKVSSFSRMIQYVQKSNKRRH